MCELFLLLLCDPFSELRDIRLSINILGEHMLPGQQLTIDVPNISLDVLQLINEDVNLVGYLDDNRIVIKKVKL